MPSFFAGWRPEPIVTRRVPLGSGETGHNATVRCRCDRAPVEDQLVIAADCVTVDDRTPRSFAAFVTRVSRRPPLPKCQGLAERLRTRSHRWLASCRTGSCPLYNRRVAIIG